MSEGAMFPWKRQEIDASRGPVASYDNIHKPLPAPPKNMYWVVDPKTREWRLEEKSPEEATTAEATLVVDSDNDILYHKIQPNDTFQGICLKYKLTPTELRQANGGFSGTNLYLAPNPLRIPHNGNVVLATATVSSQTGESNDSKVRKLRDACPQLHGKEAKCYLELNNWDYKEALANAKDDGF